MDDTALLAQSELFGFLEADELTRIVADAHTVHLSRNEVLFDQGEPAEALYGVLAGRVAITLQSPDGRESVLALMEAGDLFGDMPLFDGGARSAQARALETSDLLYIPYPAVRAVLEQRPALLWTVVATLSRRLRSTDAALADSVFLDVTGRTAKRLLELAGDSDTFALPITQEELAGLVGASRERVNKAISAFIRLGWLDQVDRHYRIADRAQLARRAR
ncbi:MAG: family transcriptional regulator, cyclic receptor protein [Acidimicrobiaceae bacterium]|jgi:CRP-like cAMP-binding protein|nr:family transcriptional regulator, cyclic receptor protein [Acidimicrobiaceae bacterium]MDQ1376489.1 family transcriptional regulator, cyclic receptor protein [Acidimicrobiaceae bacterium]MDQ1414508.1 family transcriptional regulator, cyclic receptor protein [Acidimicrobiaceae bacterium]